MPDRAFEFKALNVYLTWELWKNEQEKAKLIEAFIKRVVENACAALNARTKMTIYFGVQDNGLITGVRIEDIILVSNIYPSFVYGCT